MKKILSAIMIVLLVLSYAVFALASGESTENVQSSGSVEKAEKADDTALGDYEIDIKSCRLAEDYEGKPVVIVTYGFTNHADRAVPFYTAVSATAYQDGVGLNEAYVLADSANYNSDNQSKEIKTDASLDVEVAYVLNDTTTDIEVEVTEWISLNDHKVTKVFSIA